jgi:hypothetical protein
MSLKAFHIVFVVASIVLALGFGAWAVKQYFEVGGTSYIWYAAGSFAMALALIIYGKVVLKKLKDISYL